MGRDWNRAKRQTINRLNQPLNRAADTCRDHNGGQNNKMNKQNRTKKQSTKNKTNKNRKIKIINKEK